MYSAAGTLKSYRRRDLCRCLWGCKRWKRVLFVMCLPLIWSLATTVETDFEAADFEADSHTSPAGKCESLPTTSYQ
ncbi:unnamed protein product [Amoebophrya sp. A25]|nr:unnamed protein product [Amoebophrya sp. A25]|eukprot:GSA25T00021729001.1